MSAEIYALPGIPEQSEVPRRKTAPPESLDVTAAMLKWFESKRFPGDPAELAEEMLDWHRANGEKKLDWVATWRNWCRQNQRFTAQAERRGATKEQAATHVTDAYIDANARPGESYESARIRILRESLK